MTRLQQLISQQPVDAPSVAELLARIRQQTQQAHGQLAQIKPAQCQHTQSKNTTYQGQP